MRLVVLVLFVLLVYTQYALWFGRGGVHDVDKLRQSVTEQRAEIAALKERNEGLAAEVIDLKKGLDAIEERARTGMGMVKQGEVFFRLPDVPERAPDAPALPPPLEPIPQTPRADGAPAAGPARSPGDVQRPAR